MKLDHLGLVLLVVGIFAAGSLLGNRLGRSYEKRRMITMGWGANVRAKVSSNASSSVSVGATLRGTVGAKVYGLALTCDKIEYVPSMSFYREIWEVLEKHKNRNFFSCLCEMQLEHAIRPCKKPYGYGLCVETAAARGTIMLVERCRNHIVAGCPFKRTKGITIRVDGKEAFVKLLSLFPPQKQCALAKWAYCEEENDDTYVNVIVGPTGLINHGQSETLNYTYTCTGGQQTNKIAQKENDDEDEDDEEDEDINCTNNQTDLQVGKAIVDLPAGAEILENYCHEYDTEPRWLRTLKATMAIDTLLDGVTDCVR